MPSGIYIRTPEAKQKMSLAHLGREPNYGCGRSQCVGEIEWQGYVWLYLPQHPMVSRRGWVKRSQVIMERVIGRYLMLEEIVHHRNKVKNDDRPENLQLFANRREHTRFHAQNGDHFKPPHPFERRINWTPELRRQHSVIMKEVRAELARQGRTRIGGIQCA